jgi:type I restriction enzyme M protein
MISVGNNFFYTKSLPCTLWFFDKSKKKKIQDKVLFIDARNYYTVVDRTLNEWNEWQLKNLTAIVWLYRGEMDKYEYLLVEYSNALLAYADSTEDKQLEKILRKSAKIAKKFEELKKHRETLRALAKNAVETADKKSKKKTQEEWDARLAELDEIIGVAKEANWLKEKFGDGKYKDILGLCKIASRAEIAEKNYSLTPGAYVGVAPVEDDGVDFADRMAEIHQELLKLQDESNVLMKTISKNMKELGL